MYEDWYDDEDFDNFEKIRPKSKPRSGKEKMTAADIIKEKRRERANEKEEMLSSEGGRD